MSTSVDEDTQGALRSVARDVLTSDRVATALATAGTTDQGYDSSLWQEWAELGWLGLLVPERYGGAGYLPREAGVILTEMGRVLTGGPMLASAVLASATLSLAGDPATATRYLPKL